MKNPFVRLECVISPGENGWIIKRAGEPHRLFMTEAELFAFLTGHLAWVRREMIDDAAKKAAQKA